MITTTAAVRTEHLVLGWRDLGLLEDPAFVARIVEKWDDDCEPLIHVIVRAA